MSDSADDPTITAQSGQQTLPIGSVLAARYRIESLLGIGGMGVVYRTTDLSLQVPVAIKLLRSELSTRSDAFERFRQEVLLARQISSPHVLRIHDMGRDGDRWFISMDAVDGESLDRRLNRCGPLPLETALGITRQLALGLQAAHQCGVIHRDLKPSNVLLTEQGDALIADFGIARSLKASGLTEAGTVVGTPDYLSPEQAAGQPIDPRSDLYALGLLLYEMLSGQLPFAGETPAETMSQRIGGFVVPISSHRKDIPSWVRRLLSQLLKPRPSQRMASAEHIVQAIDARKVPIDWRSWARRAGWAVPALAALSASGLWLSQRAVPIAAKPPPDRLLVLLHSDDASERGQNLRQAVADLVRRDLQQRLDLTVVDSERSENAQDRWRGRPDNAADRQRLAQDLPFRQLLWIELDVEATALQADLYEAAGDGPSAWQQRSDGSALSLAWSPLSLAIAERLRPAAAVPIAADSAWSRTLDAAWLPRYGAALKLCRRGEVEQADQLFGALDGEFAADLQRVALALSVGDLPTARAVLSGHALDSVPLGQLLRLRVDADWDAAAALLQQQLQQHPDDLAARWQLADVLINRGDLSGAEQQLASGIAQDDGDPRAWFLRGKAAILRGDIRPAIDDYLLRATLLSKRDRNRFNEAEAVNASGLAYSRLGQMNDAEEQFRRALQLREAIGHRRGAASSLRNLAQIVMIRGGHEEARQLLERARSLLAELDDKAGLAAVDNEQGLLAEEMGDYNAALTAYRKALRSRELLDDRLGVAESLNNLGFAQFQRGDYDSAGVFWRQSIDAFRELGDQLGQVRASQNLGLLETVRGRWSDAEALLRSSLQEAEAQQFSEELAVSQRNLAELELLRGRLKQAREYQRVAARLFEARGDHRGQFDARLLEARIAMAAHADASAREVLNQLAEQRDQASLEQQVLWAVAQADLLEREGNLPARVETLDQAQAAATKSGIRSLELALKVRSKPSSDGLLDDVLALGHQPTLWRLALETLKSNDAQVADYTRLREYVAAADGGFDAWAFHALGATLAAKAGDGAAAREARQQASTALQTLVDQSPAEWQEGLREAGKELGI